MLKKIGKTIDGIVTQARTSPVQHLTLPILLHANYESAMTIYQVFSQGRIGSGIFVSMLSTIPLAFTLVSYLQSQKLRSDYERAKKHFAEQGFEPRIASVQFSFCYRNAIECAAKDTGVDNEAREYYQSLGYQRYTLFPKHFS